MNISGLTMHEWWTGKNIILSPIIKIGVEQLLFELYFDTVYKSTY